MLLDSCLGPVGLGSGGALRRLPELGWAASAEQIPVFLGWLHQ